MTNKQTYAALVADKLRRHPELLKLARGNIARWRAVGHSAPERLEEWDCFLAEAEQNAAGLERVLAILSGDDTARRRWLDFNPFAGVLTREERRQARDLCGYRH